jgi:RNA polymerase sigma factor (sigma-70 family)
MPSRALNAVVEYIRKTAGRGPAAEMTDGQLLERFVADRDENAFGALIQRHGPLVLTVCRRVLNNTHDVEDAFQATFLVLVRKAGSIAKRESVSSWLHGVARRTAVRAKMEAARRDVLKRQVQKTAAPDCMQEAILQDLRLILDEEVQRLPERYRLPFVLCYMQGKTNQEAAVLLGCPKGTILSRLSRARERLRGRLVRRGLGLSAGLIATMLSQSAASAALPTSLAGSTIKAAITFAGGTAAAGMISAKAAALAKGVLKTMIMTQLKMAASVVLTAALLGGGLLSYQTFARDLDDSRKTDKPNTVAAGPVQLQARAEPPKEKPFENAPACNWLIDPSSNLQGGGGTLFMGTRHTIAAIIESDKDGALLVTLAWKVSEGKPAPELRPVAFDAHRKRYLFAEVGSCGGYAPLDTDGVTLHRFRTDPTVVRKVAYVGIEVVPPEAHKIQARLAAEQARTAGIEVLPYPEIGKAYDFVLTTEDGRKIRSNDLNGKVVLVDFWTSRCSPCRESLSQLEAHYKKRHKDGLEIIGINLDDKAETGQKICTSLGLTYPQVWIPSDTKTRELWQQASGISSVPRLLLIDRDGILRADGRDELEEQIAKHLARSPAKTKK